MTIVMTTVLYSRKMPAMKSVSKSHLKAHMLRLFREVERSGEALVVTDNNKPVLKSSPSKRNKPSPIPLPAIGQVTYSRSVDEPTQLSEHMG